MCVQDYKSLRIAINIRVTLVNALTRRVDTLTHRHTHTERHTDLIGYSLIS